MQEEVENRTLTLTVNATKFTGRVLKAGAFQVPGPPKEQEAAKQPGQPGRCEAIRQGQHGGPEKAVRRYEGDRPARQGASEFDRIAREYKVQYAVYKTAKGQYQIFFKAPSEASMNAAFQKYSKNRLKKEQRRESVLGKLKKFKELVKAPVPNREKRREQER